jgi:hypothetical protein
MIRMKRLLLAAVAVVLALVLVLPWLLGGQARGGYESILAELPARGLRLTDARYERGWLSSNAVADLVAETAPGAPGAVRLRVASRLSHGPWSPDAPRIAPAAAIVETRIELRLPGLEPPPLLLTTVMGLDGSGETRARLPAVDRPAGAGLAGIRSAEGRGELRFAPGLASFEGHMQIPALEIDGESGPELRLQGLRAEGAGRRWLEGLFVGHAGLGIDALEVTGVPGAIRARGLAAETLGEPREGKLLDLRGELRLDAVEVEGTGYGPLLLGLGLTGMPAETVAALQHAGRTGDSGPAAVQAAAVLADQLPALLEADPRLALERLELQTPEGAVETRLWVGTRRLTREALTLPGAWLAHLEGAATLAVPRSLLLDLLAGWERSRTLAELRRLEPDLAEVPPEREPEIAAAAALRLAGLVRDGWAAEEGGRVQTSARLADGLLTVNGKTLPIAGAGIAAP